MSICTGVKWCIYWVFRGRWNKTEDLSKVVSFIAYICRSLIVVLGNSSFTVQLWCQKACKK